jgi:hypothetical protein
MSLKIFQLDVVANSGIIVPEMIDYTHAGLFRKQTEVKGALMKSEFFKNFENNVYSDLIVEEVYEYIESNPLYIGKKTSVNWYDTDDTIGHIKEFTYMFLPNEIIDFGINKRSNVLAIAILYIFQGTLSEANAFDLLDYCQGQIITYVQGNSAPIITRLNESVVTKPYMTQQIADAVIAILTDL